MDNSIVMDLESMLLDESAEPKALPLSLLDEITGGFSQMQIIGSGGFAVVYVGILINERVAVKKLSNTHLHETEFQREVECLMRVKHKNIVRFLGYCADTQGSVLMHNKRHVLADVQSRLLCFEYVPNGSLRDHISDASSGLQWRRLYRIIKSICDGLNYLHKNCIVHLDLKPANILMDENMEPKIADFGLSRCFDEEQSKVMTTKLFGTLGYMPPEFSSHVITRGYDIYSLGVIIIEILTGEKGYHRTEDVLESWRNRMEKSHEAGELEQIRVCSKIGNKCTKTNPGKRPCSVQDIIDMLHETEVNEPSEEQMSLSMAAERGLLHVHQCQLRFPLFEPDKHISSQLRLSNNTKDHIAFRCLPKIPESFIGGLSNLDGIVPPRSTRTFLVEMKKQPPENIKTFDMILESSVAHIRTKDASINFLPEIMEEVRGKVHQVPLVALFNPAGESIRSQTKIICRVGNERRVVSMDVHPTEPWVLVGHRNGNVSIWNYQTQERVVELGIALSLVRACAFVAREDWCVLGDGHGVIHVRSCKTMELEQVKKFKAHDGVLIIAMAVHPSLPFLLSGCEGHLIKLWDWAKDWKCLRIFRGHHDQVEALKFNPRDDGHDRITFVSVSLDGKANIWDISQFVPIDTLDCNGGLTDVDYYLPGGNDQYIITGPLSGNARMWDLRTRKCIRVIRGTTENGNCYKARVVHCPPDPPLLMKFLEDSSVALCDFTTSRIKNSIDFGFPHGRTMVYINGMRSVMFSFQDGVAMLDIN